MTKYILLLALFGSCGMRQGGAAVESGTLSADSVQAVANVPPNAPSVEDTVRLQIGGKLFYPDFDPSDSITVIEAVCAGEYRQYRFILHDRHSRAHRSFEPQTLDSTYKADEAYFRGDKEPTTAIRPDSIHLERIDPALANFTGYWVYLTEYEGDYYLDDIWAWRSSFRVGNGMWTWHYMDGPYPEWIVQAEALPDGGISLRLYDHDRPIRIEPIDPARQVYRFTDIDGRPALITPASAIHNFEMIEYVNSTGDLI